MDFHAVKSAAALAVLALAACGGPGPAEPQAAKAAPATPPSVRYQEYGTAGKGEPPAADLTNPLSGDPATIQQGQVLFDTMNCSGCHGPGGIGFIGPSLIDGRWRYGAEDGALFHSIFYGRPRGMPAYGGMLSETTVWQLVIYLRAQPEPEVVPTVTWR